MQKPQVMMKVPSALISEELREVHNGQFLVDKQGDKLTKKNSYVQHTILKANALYNRSKVKSRLKPRKDLINPSGILKRFISR